MRKVERQLRERLKNAEQQVKELQEERDKFRGHFVTRFRWWIQLLGEQKTPNMSWLVEADAKFLVSVQRWYWG